MASTLLTLAAIRELVETDLSDTALSVLVDDADAEITRGFGAHDVVASETFYPASGERVVYLAQAPNAGLPITVSWTSAYGGAAVNVLASEYALAGSRLQLLAGWGGVIRVTYTPVSDLPRRRRVLVDLVKLATAHQGVSASRAGDVSVNHVDYEAERGRILARLASLQSSFA